MKFNRVQEFENLFVTGPIPGIEAALAAGNLPTHCIFHGSPGCGKTTVTRIIAATLLKLEGKEKDELINNGVYNGPEYSEINTATCNKVDDARDLEKSILDAVDSFSDKPYIFVLEEAQRYTPDAQDALLNVFEKTYSNVYVFITTSEIRKLKPTIIRRFTQYKFGPLPYNQAMRYLEELLKKAKIKDIDVETRQKIIQISDGAPGFILSHLQTFLTSGEIPNEKELDPHKASDLYKAFRKCTTDTFKGEDMSHSMNHLLTVLLNFKQSQGEWESVRIAFLIYIHFTMKSCIEAGKFTQKNREIFTAYYDLLTPFLMENRLGEYDMVSRLMKMIEARKNIELKFKGEGNGSKED